LGFVLGFFGVFFYIYRVLRSEKEFGKFASICVKNGDCTTMRYIRMQGKLRVRGSRGMSEASQPISLQCQRGSVEVTYLFVLAKLFTHVFHSNGSIKSPSYLDSKFGLK